MNQNILNKQVNEFGLKSSNRRNVVVKTFESHASDGKHITVDELYDHVKKADPKIGYTTVWRALKKLESLGLASAQKFHDGFTRYECIKGDHHHDHLICIDCGKVEEFLNTKIEEIQNHVAAKHKFQITNHKMELYGYCRKCKK